MISLFSQEIDMQINQNKEFFFPQTCYFLLIVKPENTQHFWTEICSLVLQENNYSWEEN